MKLNKTTNTASRSILGAIQSIALTIVLSLGVAGLLNWKFGFLNTNSWQQYALHPLTSASLILCAIAIIMLNTEKSQWQHRFVPRVISILVIGIAVSNMASHFDGKPLLNSVQSAVPVNSAFLFLLTGFAILLSSYKKHFFSQSLSLITGAFAIFSLIGRIHNMPQFYVPFKSGSIVVPGIVCMLLLAASMLASGREKGYMAEITSRYSGGQIARRLLPMLVLTPIFLEFVRLYGEESGWYTSEFGVVLFFSAILIIFLFTILSSVKLANKIDLSLEEEIDEREKAETEIKESNRFLETILENIPNMIFVKKGKELRFAAINKAGEKLLGIPRHEYIGKTDDDIFPEDQARFFKKKDMEVFNSEAVVVIEEEVVHTKDGERWLRTKKIPVKDGRGNPLYIVGISEDITEKREQNERIKQFYSELECKVKERTQELSNSEKRFRALIENSTDGITITDEGSGIIYESPAVERMTGYSAMEKAATLLFDHIFPDDLEKCRKLYDDLAAFPGKPIFQQFRIRHKNGEYIWVEGTATNLLCDQSVKAIIFNYRDITERKKHEHERELLILELTKHNKDLRQFSYITSHNLRAPVSNLLGLLSLLKYTPVEDPSLKEILDGFQISTNALNDTINDLLSVLYIKENTPMEMEDISVPDMVNKVFMQVSNLIEEIKPEVSFEVKANSVIYFNRTYFESIFLNLLTNALKYRSDKRRLKITIKLQEFEDKTIVTFEDNGIGFDLATVKPKIFGLYQRFHNHPDSKGLGLYLVKTHMEALGGSIDLESAVDAGTKFILTFNKIYAEQGSLH